MTTMELQDMSGNFKKRGFFSCGIILGLGLFAVAATVFLVCQF